MKLSQWDYHFIIADRSGDKHCPDKSGDKHRPDITTIRIGPETDRQTEREREEGRVREEM